MAQATANYREVVESVKLTLSGEEAQTLRDILEHIGGCPDTSRRRFMDSIKRALSSERVYASCEEDIRESSAIYFK